MPLSPPVISATLFSSLLWCRSGTYSGLGIISSSVPGWLLWCWGGMLFPVSVDMMWWFRFPQFLLRNKDMPNAILLAFLIYCVRNRLDCPQMLRLSYICDI